MFDIIDTVFDALKSFASSIADAISGAVMDMLNSLIGNILLWVTQRLCEVVHAVYSIFAIFAGITKVEYNGEATYLFNVFFENSTVSSIYWGMAMIGFVLLFGFTIFAILQKVFDLNDRKQHSIGQILGSAFKSFLVMISLTAILTFSVTLCNVLIQQVSYVFDQGNTLAKRQEIKFTDEQYATMARILNTIGNYSLNPGYSQRYNMNTCYNEIRPDLLYLQSQGVFDLQYPEVDEEGNKNPTWQSALEKLVLANDPNHELRIDVLYTEVNQAMEEIISYIRYDAEFYPIEEFKNKYASASSVPLDRVLFLSGTMDSARNNYYNQNPGMDDGLRGAFYIGEEKSIYSKKDVESAFNIGIGGINYLMIWFGWYWVMKNLVRCILSCVARIINVVGLYIVAPPIAAVMPLDDGQKFKEWTTAIIIQMVGIFGSIIPMRLVMMFLPIVMDSKLVLLSSPVLNLFAKVVLLYGMMEAVGRFGGILTGILANNAGGEALRALDYNDKADKKFSRLGGKFMPFSTDVDDPNGDRKRAEKDRKEAKDEKKKREAENKKNNQALQTSNSKSGSGGSSKSSNGGSSRSSEGGDSKSEYMTAEDLPNNEQGQQQGGDSNGNEETPTNQGSVGKNGTDGNATEGNTLQTNGDNSNDTQLPENQQGQQGGGDNNDDNTPGSDLADNLQDQQGGGEGNQGGDLPDSQQGLQNSQNGQNDLNDLNGQNGQNDLNGQNGQNDLNGQNGQNGDNNGVQQVNQGTYNNQGVSTDGTQGTQSGGQKSGGTGGTSAGTQPQGGVQVPTSQQPQQNRQTSGNNGTQLPKTNQSQQTSRRTVDAGTQTDVTGSTGMTEGNRQQSSVPKNQNNVGNTQEAKNSGGNSGNNQQGNPFTVEQGPSLNYPAQSGVPSFSYNDLDTAQKQQILDNFFGAGMVDASTGKPTYSVPKKTAPKTRKKKE